MDYTLSTTWTIILLILVIWELIWKAVALWRASHREQTVWFVALLVINSAGILPIIYLLVHGDLASRNKEAQHHETITSV